MDLPTGRAETDTFWRSHFAAMKAAGLAPVQNNPLGRDLFMDITVEGSRFQGWVSKSGPYIINKKPLAESCALGVASINYCRPFYDNGDPDKHPAWRICKYHTQGHIELPPLTDAGRRALAYHFGLPLVPQDPGRITLMIETAAFYASPAFDALIAWARQHPRKIKAAKPNAYLLNWPQAAMSGRAADAFKRDE